MSDAYVPVYNEASGAWYPCNRAAELLVHLNHIWSDITTLNNLRMKEDTDAITDKLLFKYIVIEFISLLDAFKELQGIVMKSPRLVKGKPAPWRFITKREHLETKRLVKEFWRSFQPVQKELYEIRNEIGAHRRLSDLASAQTLWKQLEVEKYVAVLNKFLPLFAHLKELNIYEWSRSLGEQDGKIALSMFGTLIIPPWEDAFDLENETI
jgi:hypothetical protein